VENYFVHWAFRWDLFSTYPDGQTLATGKGQTIKLWNLRTGELIRTLSGIPEVFGVAVSLMVKP